MTKTLRIVVADDERDTREYLQTVLPTLGHEVVGVAETVITRQGRDRIVAELPGIENPQRAIELIGKTALLEFVDTGSTSLPRGAEWTGPDTVVIADNKTTAKIPKKVILTALCGHGHLDLAAYGSFLAGEVSDHELSDADLAAAVAELPQVPA